MSDGSSRPRFRGPPPPSRPPINKPSDDLDRPGSTINNPIILDEHDDTAKGVEGKDDTGGKHTAVASNKAKHG